VLGRRDGSGRPQWSAPKSRRLVLLRHTYCTVRLRQPRLTRDHKGEPLLRGVSLRLRQSDATSHFEQKHGAVRIAPSRLNKSQSHSGASDGSGDPGSPAGPLSARTKNGLGPRVDQIGTLLGRYFSRPSRPTVPTRRLVGWSLGQATTKV
jgi:hypothetical protein